MSNQSPRREYLPIDERRERLLNAAVDVMVADGADAVSLRSVAARSGVAHRVVHYAFGSKAELVSAILTRESARRMALFWDVPLPHGSLEDAIAHCLRMLAADLRESPERHQAMADLASGARADAQLSAAARAESDAYHAAIVARLEEWCTSVDRRLVIPIDVAAATVLAAASGLVDWWLTCRDDTILEPVIAQLGAAFREVAVPV